MSKMLRKKEPKLHLHENDEHYSEWRSVEVLMDLLASEAEGILIKQGQAISEKYIMMWVLRKMILHWDAQFRMRDNNLEFRILRPRHWRMTWGFAPPEREKPQ